MAESKKFYWIKLKQDFFDIDAIDWLASQKNGCEYIVLYQKLCLLSANRNGRLFSEIGEMIIPYDAQKISRDTKFDYDTVTVALELFKRLKLIFIEDDGVLSIPYVDEVIGSETDRAEKVRKWRESKAIQQETLNHNAISEKSQCDHNVISEKSQRASHCDHNVTQDIDIEKEKEKEIRERSKLSDNYKLSDDLEKDTADYKLSKKLKKTSDYCVCGADAPPTAKAQSKNFIPPTVEEVKAYCAENQTPIYAEQFIDFYAAKDWYIGKNKMKDWRAAVRQWYRRDKENGKVYKPPNEAEANDLDFIFGKG